MLKMSKFSMRMTRFKHILRQLENLDVFRNYGKNRFIGITEYMLNDPAYEYADIDIGHCLWTEFQIDNFDSTISIIGSVKNHLKKSKFTIASKTVPEDPYAVEIDSIHIDFSHFIHEIASLSCFNKNEHIHDLELSGITKQVLLDNHEETPSSPALYILELDPDLIKENMYENCNVAYILLSILKVAEIDVGIFCEECGKTTSLGPFVRWLNIFTKGSERIVGHKICSFVKDLLDKDSCNCDKKESFLDNIIPQRQIRNRIKSEFSP